MKVAKVKRTINGRALPRATYENVHLDISDDRQVNLLAEDFQGIAEGYYHNVFTATNTGGFHLRVELMVLVRPLSNNPGQERPAEFDYETWYIAFYSAGKDTP